MTGEEPVRTFETGATRNNDSNELDYEGFFSPLVLKAYAEYMHSHRKQSDGKLRASDNWQNLFGENHFAVCMKSLWRHMMDLWMIHRGHKARGTIDDAICGVLFNTSAYYHKLLVERERKGGI